MLKKRGAILTVQILLMVLAPVVAIPLLIAALGMITGSLLK